MVRTLLKIVAGLVALVLLLLGALAVALPRLVNTEEFRTALHEAAAEAAGSPVEWENVEVGLLPPRLVVESPVLVGADGRSEDAMLTASSVDLRLAWWRLPERRIEVDSLVIRGLELVVTRTPDGIILPFGGAEDAEEAQGAESTSGEDALSKEGEPDADAASEDEGGFELALRRFVITDAEILVHDRALEKPLDWRLTHFELEAKGDSLDQPIALELATDLLAAGAPVGTLATEGTVTLGGLYDLEIQVEELGLLALAPYIPDAHVAGSLSGRISVEGATSQLAETDLDVVIRGLEVRAQGLSLAGDLALIASQELDEAADFDARLTLAQGGKIQAQGEASLEGAIDTEVELEGVDLAPFASLAGGDFSVAGIVTGKVGVIATPEGGISRLTTNLKIASARYADATLDLGGDVDLVATMTGSGPIRFDVGLDLASGGQIAAKGVGTLEGAVDASAELEAVDLAPFAPLIPEGTSLAGRLSGKVDVKATSDGTLERVGTDLRIDAARLISDPLDFSGSLSLVAGMQDDGPVRIDAGLQLSDGGTLDLDGTTTLDGVLDLEAKVEKFDLAIASPFLPDPEMQLAGLITGDLRVVGAASTPEFVKADVGIESGLLKSPDYSVEGPLLIDLRVKEPLSGRPRGKLTLDLTATQIAYQDMFAKAAGIRAEMVTKFVPEKSGDVVFESQIKFHEIDDMLLQGFVGKKTSVAVTTPLFNLKGWHEIIPMLAPYDLDGPIAFDGLGVELTDGSPSQFGGRIQIRGIGFSLPDAGRMRLRGQILGEGSRIRAKGLKLTANGLTLGIKGLVEEPLREANYELEILSLGEAEVNDLLTALTSVSNTVYGPLKLDGKISGFAGENYDPYGTLEGHFKFSIGEGKGGRLRGVSILRAVLDQIPLLGGAAKLTQPFRGGRSVDDYFTEEFEIIEGDFEMGGGKVNAKKLRLAYEGYEAKLSGPLKLKDMTIDMTGELLIKGDLVSAMGGLMGSDGTERKPIRIPLARVTNTISDPKIEMTKETLAAIPKLLFQATGLDSLATGAGKALGRMLGGKR